MAMLDDDTLLGIFAHCDIDTFFTLRTLSRAVHALICKNLATLCKEVARSTFSGQTEIYAPDREDVAHDVAWLRVLRFRQLAAILVECTNQHNHQNDLLNAEDPRGRTDRAEMTRASQMLARLHDSAWKAVDLEDNRFPADTQFTLPVGTDGASGRTPGPQDEYLLPQNFGVPVLAPFPLTGETISLWRRRSMILRQQTLYLEELDDNRGPGEELIQLGRALMYEFAGRWNNIGIPRWPPQRKDIESWDHLPPTAFSLLQDFSLWLWTTVLDAGPKAFWKDRWSQDHKQPSMMDHISRLRSTETFEEQLMKSLVGQVFLIGLVRLMNRRVDPLWPRGRRTYSVFKRGQRKRRRHGQIVDSPIVPRSFSSTLFDMRLRHGEGLGKLGEMMRWDATHQIVVNAPYGDDLPSTHDLRMYAAARIQDTRTSLTLLPLRYHHLSTDSADLSIRTILRMEE